MAERHESQRRLRSQAEKEEILSVRIGNNKILKHGQAIGVIVVVVVIVDISHESSLLQIFMIIWRARIPSFLLPQLPRCSSMSWPH